MPGTVGMGSKYYRFPFVGNGRYHVDIEAASVELTREIRAYPNIILYKVS